MRIACPACNAAYDVPDTELRDDRVVRCARCGTDWAPVVPLPAAVPETGPEMGPELLADAAAARDLMPSGEAMLAGVAVEPAPEPRQMALDADAPVAVAVAIPAAPAVVARRAVPTLAIAWALSVLVVVGGLVTLAVKRDRVMAAWPPSTRLYAALGLAAR